MGMNRREAIKLVATASAALWTPEEAASARAKATAVRAQSEAGAPFQPEFFSAHEYDTVCMVVDLIIPADNRSGSATEAGVPEFMDFMMIDRPNMQEWMRGGLAWLDIESHRRFDRPFLDASDEERTEILDAIAWPERAEEGMSHGVAFFNRFRDLTASGFWSTEMGINDLQYQGNTVMREWVGCPEDALRHVGVIDAGD
jgi:hypothetical protein